MNTICVGTRCTFNVFGMNNMHSAQKIRLRMSNELQQYTAKMKILTENISSNALYFDILRNKERLTRRVTCQLYGEPTLSATSTHTDQGVLHCAVWAPWSIFVNFKVTWWFAHIGKSAVNLVSVPCGANTNYVAGWRALSQTEKSVC